MGQLARLSKLQSAKKRLTIVSGRKEDGYDIKYANLSYNEVELNLKCYNFNIRANEICDVVNSGI